MKEDIKNFPEQLSFSPRIERGDHWKRYEKYFLSGMGGSHLQGDILKTISPEFPLFLHQNYGLPKSCSSGATLIAASYSGNTEEVLDSLQTALSRGLPVAAVSKGGRLIQIAREKQLPHIELPDEKIQPRVALGHSFRGLLRLLDLREMEDQALELSGILKNRQDELEKEGQGIAGYLREKIPVVYASANNSALARIWKINFNETSKIPSFCNVLPELNHNEMTGFDMSSITKHLSEKISFLFLVDKEDHPKISKRMDVLEKLLQSRGLEVFKVEIRGSSKMEKVFSCVLSSMWSSYYLAKSYDNDPENVPMVEEFKKRLTA